MTHARVIAAEIGRAAQRIIPACKVHQLAIHKLWLLEYDEPFCEIEIDDHRLTVRVAVHCSPEWAAKTVIELNKIAPVEINTEPFIQNHRGQVLYGEVAELYWREYRRLEPLVSPRFRAPNPYPI